MFQHRRFVVAIALAGSIAFASATVNAYAQESGQRTFAQVSVEPAIDYSTGNTIYLLTPVKAPFPSKANPVATAPLYLGAMDNEIQRPLTLRWNHLRNGAVML